MESLGGFYELHVGLGELADSMGEGGQDDVEWMRCSLTVQQIKSFKEALLLTLARRRSKQSHHYRATISDLWSL